ncbi:MAG: hypothetical protein AAGE65_01860 [Planctomycetota bacterium]
MSLPWAMMMLLVTWTAAGAVALCLGSALWRLLGLERGAGLAVEPSEPAASENDFALPDRFRAAHPPPQTFVGPLDTLHRATLSFGLGLVALVALLSAWHLVLPVNPLACGALLIAAALAGVWAWPELSASLAAVRKSGRTVLVVWALVGVWLSNRAAGGAELAVTGLAWYPLVGWTDAYPAVPGLGNLNPVYGWNAGGLLVSSWLSEGPWVGRVGQVSNGWLLWWVSLPSVVACGKLLEQTRDKPRTYVDTQGVTKKTTIGTVYDACWLTPVVVLGMGTAVTDPLPGVGAGVLLWLALGALFRASGPDEPHRGRRIDALLAALVCAVGAGAWDPMAWPAALVVSALIAWRLMKSERAWVEGRRPTRSIGLDHEKLPGLQARSGGVAAAGVLAAVVMLLWAARNVVLTGYVAFPLSTAGALPLDWTLAASDARGLTDWLPRASPVDSIVGGLGIVDLPALVGVVLVLAWLARGGSEGRWKFCGLAGVAAVLAAASWFLSGRGVGAFGPAWATLAIGLALNARAVVQRGRPAKGPSGMALVGGLGVASIVLSAVHVLTFGGASLWPVGPQAQAALAIDQQPQARDDDAQFSKLLPVRLPFTSTAGLAERITPDLRPWLSRWGVEVALTAPPLTIPTPNADAPAGPLPWAAPQPSMTQAPSVDLQYRGGPDQLRAGFRIDRTDPGSFADPTRPTRSADRQRRLPGGGS